MEKKESTDILRLDGIFEALVGYKCILLVLNGSNRRQKMNHSIQQQQMQKRIRQYLVHTCHLPALLEKGFELIVGHVVEVEVDNKESVVRGEGGWRDEKGERRRTSRETRKHIDKIKNTGEKKRKKHTIS